MGVPLEGIRYSAEHVVPRTTRLQSRRQEPVRENVVEPNSIEGEGPPITGGSPVVPFYF